MTAGNINLKRVLEAILFVAPEPVSAGRLEELTAGIRREGERVKDVLVELAREYEDEERSFTIRQVAEGYQLRTREIYASWIRKLYQTRRSVFLSKPALETLAIIAYKQPVTRAEIEAIRGVAVDGLLKSLLDRELIKIAGQKDVVGRPYLYRTCRKFLEHFGLGSLSDLPPLGSREKPTGKKMLSAAPAEAPAAGSAEAEKGTGEEET
jgi:segregation and condensation protein B